MIAPNLQELLTTFTARWNPALGTVPGYALDYAWPTVGVVDLMSFGLRLKPQLNEQETFLLRGCTLYLAKVTQSCWQRVIKNVQIIEDENGIALRASGGEHLAESEQIYLPIEKLLRQLLANLPDPFPVLRGFDRRISFDANVLSLFGIGCCTATTPFLEGEWADKSFGELKVPLQEFTKELARQTAEYYAKVFPQEPLGAVAELYLNATIFPPLLVGEELPAVAALRQILEFAKGYSIGAKQLNQLAYNWMRIPDDSLSHIGLVLYAATSQKRPPAEVIAFAESKSRFIGLLRHAFCETRNALGDESSRDWLIDGISSEADELQFWIETDLMMCPWLVLPIDCYRQDAPYEKYRDFVLAACAFDLEEASRVCNAVTETEPANLDLRLQQIRFEMLKGDVDKVDALCRSLLSEPDADRSPLLFHLWSQNELQREKIESAAKYCKAGIAVSPSGDPLKAELENNLGWALLLQGEFERALPHFETAASTGRCPVTAKLNAAHALWRLKRQDEAEALQRQVAALAPFDRRIFGAIASGLLL